MCKALYSISGILFICLIITLICSPVFAAEQNPDYLKYQEPQPVYSSTLSNIAYVFTLVVTFAVVIGLAYFTSRFLGQKMGRLTGSDNSRIRSILPLGPNRAIYVVEIAGQFLVVGVTDHNINLLKEITSTEEIEKLQLMQTGPVGDQFDYVFRKSLASLQKMSHKFPAALGNTSEGRNERGERK